MYLKAVELQGFKSFPDKTRLNFEKNITAIVGPNGSGKSNISDAIRWVMGEQRTKQLRGEKMEDVIFGGTEKRGKLGYARVSLIFDNSTRFFDMDASEVVLTRAYYRTGESEYFINHEQVRLKDVNELLMDTGLGRDGYSSIGQGRISEIVSGNGQERRNVLEEAAGISRYRYRKEEAERKLERTQENLVRIHDRIAELELQVTPLKRQAEVAQKCLGYQAELKELEVSVWMNDLDRLHSQAEAVRNDYETAKRDLDRTHAELARLYAAGERLTGQMQEKTLESERLRTYLSQRENEGAALRSDEAVLRSDLRNAQEQILRMQMELEEHAGRAEAMDRQIAAHDARMAAIAEELEQVAAQSREILRSVSENAEVDRAARKEYSELVERESAGSGELTQCRTQMHMLAERVQEDREREAALQGSLLSANEKLTDTQRQLETARSERRKADEGLHQAQTALQTRKQAVDEGEKRLRQLQDEESGLRSDWKVVGSRIDLLEEMEREHEGFNRAVRFVLKEKEHGGLSGIRGAVGELIQTADAYAVAIETALGAAAQNIVVETQEDGAQAIRLLKRRDMGRCTFLPMNVIRGQKPGFVPERDPGFVGVADELVECAREYREILSSLLGRTMVVKTMEDAIRISREPGAGRIRMVTLDGQMINAGGSMTGGSLAKNTGILSRANELNRLKGRREELDAQLVRLQKEVSQGKAELDDRILAVQTSQSRVHAAEETAQQRQLDEQRCGMLLSSVTDTAESLKKELQELQEQIGESQQRRKAAERQAEELEQELITLRGQISEMSAGQTESERVRQELSQQLTEVKAREASLRAENRTVEQAKLQVAALRQTVAEDRQDRENRAQTAKEQAERYQLEITRKEEALAENVRQTQLLRSKAEEIDRQRMELEGARTRTDKQAQECNRQLLEMERLSAKFEQKKLASEMEEKQILDRLWDTYGLSHSAAQTMRQPVERPGASARRIAELHKAISELGTPNFGAIDEYARVSERYEFLTSQRDDVERSKREIQQIIREVTEQMQEVFQTQFQVINDCFRQTFLELFGGGKAALVLQDEEDVLGCGIDIRVQPPGKAVSSINLLSGGEMAFVAIALYFAIMKVRPTPFCVMDEIEAALDEANVIRFAEYLRKMCDTTQFIVITHRRGTMEEANRLYGVTMQEKGISQIIEMDIEEAERQIAAEEG